jgi:hypothetical protein
MFLFRALIVGTLTILPAAAQDCSVTYSVINSWPTGFQAAINIVNTGSSPINGWTLQWTFSGSQQITTLWNGVATQTGAAVSVTNESYNAVISPGGSVSNIGFTANLSGANSQPSSFNLNGAPCNGGAAIPAAPSALAAKAVSSTAVNLSWSASPNALTYNVYRSSISGFTPSAGTRIATGVAATTFTDSGAPASSTLFYLVTAVNTAGESGPSNQAAASTSVAISSISPTTGVAGSSVTITGSAFGSSQESSVVDFGVTPAVVAAWGSNSITATVPSLMAGAVSVTVRVNGMTSNPVSFTVTNTPPPTTFTGNATHFDALGSPFGGCGLPQANLDSQNFVALNVQNTPGNYTTSLPRPIPPQDASEIGLFDNGLNCGRWVKVTIGNFCTGTNDGAPNEPFCRGGSWVPDQFNGATLDMVVADSCQDGNAWCRDDPNHLDLATASINQFIKDGQPVGDLLNHWNNRQISWEFIAAPNYTGDIKIGFSQGANPFWSAISISHLRNGIHGVQYFSGGTWVEAKTNADLGQTYVVLPTTTDGSSYEIRVTDASDQLINNGRIYLFSFPQSCGQQCSPPYTPITYTVQ